MRIFNNRITLTEDEEGIPVEVENSFVYEKNTYCLSYLSNSRSSKGGNSNVYTLKNLTKSGKDLAIKVCNYSKPKRGGNVSHNKRYARFINEIAALRQLNDNNNRNIVKLQFDYVLTVKDKEFPCYIMEKADMDLKDYILKYKDDIDEQDKIKYCVDIFNSVKELHDEGFYHRDIKPDNILLFFEDEEKEKATLKLGDLGLIAHRDKDYDDIGEKIGPIGWLSPEAMNKMLTEEADLSFDCKIDEKSDIFQLGKLFWFIFQCNAPIGQISFSDFICQSRHKEDVFLMIEEMLKHSKENRASRETVELYLYDIAKRYAAI